mmetsp:Transcript_32552/g.28818  ORF Transcript_32552/g.28818 Transcript_32552/m.28818 type:complete len:146 (-) Transcript_32552:143-580(-)
MQTITPQSYDLGDYCLCNVNQLYTQESTLGTQSNNMRKISEHEDQEYYTKRNTSTNHTHKNRTIFMYQKLEELHCSLAKCSETDRFLINGRRKLSYKASKVSSRRSIYTGVFKNGAKWQALISIKMKKTYIQTYSTEQEAAGAFD